MPQDTPPTRPTPPLFCNYDGGASFLLPPQALRASAEPSESSGPTTATEYQFQKNLGAGANGTAVLFASKTKQMPPRVVIKSGVCEIMDKRKLPDGKIIPLVPEQYFFPDGPRLKLEAEHNALIHGVGIFSGNRDDTATQHYILIPYFEGRMAHEISFQSFHELGLFLIDLLNAVAAIHALNLVHRDIKSDNIIVTSERIVKMIDFGSMKKTGQLARAFLAPDNDSAANIPPECIASQADIDAKKCLYPVQTIQDSYGIAYVFNELCEILDKKTSDSKTNQKTDIDAITKVGWNLSRSKPSNRWTVEEARASLDGHFRSRPTISLLPLTLTSTSTDPKTLALFFKITDTIREIKQGLVAARITHSEKLIEACSNPEAAVSIPIENVQEQINILKQQIQWLSTLLVFFIGKEINAFSGDVQYLREKSGTTLAYGIFSERKLITLTKEIERHCTTAIPSNQ